MKECIEIVNTYILYPELHASSHPYLYDKRMSTIDMPWSYLYIIHTVIPGWHGNVCSENPWWLQYSSQYTIKHCNNWQYDFTGNILYLFTLSVHLTIYTWMMDQCPFPVCLLYLIHRGCFRDSKNLIVILPFALL